MSNIAKWNFYKKQKCNNCGFYWDYPFPNRHAMTDLQNLFYFEIHLCPHCNSIGDDITAVGNFELEVQNDKQYKQIIKDRNIAFSMTFKKEAYKYLLFAYICEKKEDYLKASKSYYMASRVERYQRGKYMDSMLYNEHNDSKMLLQSEQKEIFYLSKSIEFMKKYLALKPSDIDARIMIIMLYKLNYMQDEAVIELNYVMKQNLTPVQIKMVKDLASMKLGDVNFFNKIEN